ncbi:helix-turn-helix domain-containing protein [Halocatena marina]|uniref:Helix-turn-helix domain-containing protein n=1 Tax=Halocatena marina TaxID=2934937 RepID=A0ABD5YGW3_9EURY|nr:helix-turn-helix domain-containing protein [Halocatena marina]
MKYLTLSLGPTQLVFHPIDHCLAAQDSITRETLLHFNARFNETFIVLYQLAGNRETIEATVRDHDDVLNYEIVPVEDGSVYVFLHLDVSHPVGQLVQLSHEHALIIDTPITFDENNLFVTLVGIDTSLRNVLQSIPDEIDVSVHDAGGYYPDTNNLLSLLTERQLEVFETAVEHGYYDVPRCATHQDIADELGCAPSTVDEHLRKAEASVVPRLF